MQEIVVDAGDLQLTLTFNQPPTLTISKCIFTLNENPFKYNQNQSCYSIIFNITLHPLSVWLCAFNSDNTQSLLHICICITGNMWNDSLLWVLYPMEYWTHLIAENPNTACWRHLVWAKPYRSHLCRQWQDENLKWI